MSTGAKRPHLSVLVPAYNEQERLAAGLARIIAYLDEQCVEFEILVVDDGSTDGTSRVANQALAGGHGRVLRSAENRGKGNAVREGLLAAAGRWVLLTDADQSTPIEEHAKLAAVARDYDVDVVIGSRALADSQIEVRQVALRESMGKIYNHIVRAMTGLPFRDTQCGFKLMDRKRVRPLFERMVVDGFAFDVELLFLCMKTGLEVREVPVIWRNEPESKVGILTAPPAMLVDLLRVRWRYRRGLYHRAGETTTAR